MFSSQSSKGNVLDKVIEGAYKVLGIFDSVEEKRDAMQFFAANCTKTWLQLHLARQATGLLRQSHNLSTR